MKIFRYLLLFLLLSASSFAAFVLAPPAEGLGESSRILYFHVPAAWMSVLAFFFSGLFAALFLFRRKHKYALLMHNGAELGMLFITAALISGAVWAQTAWGVFWNWDPRETSVALIMLIYIGYFSIPSGKHSAQLPRAGYLLISAAVMPLFIFILPRMYPTLHPSPIINNSGKVELTSLMRLALFSSLFAYTVLFAVLYNTSYRIANALHKKEEE